MYLKKYRPGLASLILFLAGLVLIAPASQADDWPGVLKKIQDKYAEYEKQIKDMTIQQEILITTAGREITSEATLYKKNPKFRMDSTIELAEMPKEMGPMKTVVINDGQETWMISSMMGKQKMTGDDEKQFQTSQDWWTYMNANAEITGSEKIGGRDCYIIKMLEPETSPFSSLWVDKKDLVLVKGLTEIKGAEKIEMTFSEFKKVEGDWLIPYKLSLIHI